jgi:hypothetical protein
MSRVVEVVLDSRLSWLECCANVTRLFLHLRVDETNSLGSECKSSLSLPLRISYLTSLHTRPKVITSTRSNIPSSQCKLDHSHGVVLDREPR